MTNNLSSSVLSLFGAALISLTASFMWAEEAAAMETCYASNTAGNPFEGEIHFPGVSYDGLYSAYRTYSRIAQLFKTSANVTVTTVKLNNIFVTGTPGDVRLGLWRTTNTSSQFPYYTPFPLSVPPEAQIFITEDGPADAWVTYHLNTPVDLAANTFYAVGLYVDWPYSPPTPPAAPADYWSVQRGFANPYSLGRIVYLTNTGWATMTDDASDLLFEVCFESDIDYVPVSPVTGGEAILVTDAGTLASVTPIEVPTDNTPNADFPFGMFDFSITGLTPGETVTLTLTFDEYIPVGTKWWKYQGSGNWISLDIGSDDGDKVITVDLQDNGAEDSDPTPGVIGDPGGPGLRHPIDLDIAAFRVSKGARIGGKDITPKLVVKNYGAYDYETRTATVVGVQNAVEVYNESMEVEDGVGNGRSTYKFLPYQPTVPGVIAWTATIADDDPDVDAATAATNVK